MTSAGPRTSPGSPGPGPTRRARFAVIARALGPYARPHRRRLASALVASLFLTGVQLAFPWPLKLMVDLTRPGVAPHAGASSPAVLALGLGVLGLAYGLAEYWQRVTLARFVVHSVNDARLGLFARALAGSFATKAHDPGDTVTRMVTDTGKLRTGLKGATVHLLQHGLFVLGVCTVLLAVDVRLGLTYLLGLGVAVGVALVGADLTAAASRRLRDSESRRLTRLFRATGRGREVPAKDPARARNDALITQIKGRTAFLVQAILGVTGGVVLVLAVRASETGAIGSGDVALVASYLLMLHYPMTRFGRQITRLGPQLTSAERLARLASTEPMPAPVPEPVPEPVPRPAP